MRQLPWTKLIRYGIAGAFGAAIQIGCLYIFTHLFSLWYLTASIIAYIFSVTASFIIQKFWTFDNQTLHRVHVQFSAYVAIFIVNLVLNTGLMHLFVDRFGIWYLAAQAIACVVIAIPSYFLYQFFIFRVKPAAEYR